MLKHSSMAARIACLALALALALSSLPVALAEGVVKASKITLSKKALTLYVTNVDDDPLTTKHTHRLTPVISPRAAQERALSEGLIDYCSSKPAVASVDPLTGEIKAHKVGRTTITGKLRDGSNKKSSVKVTVKALPPQSVSLDSGSALTMEKGSRIVIAASVFPGTVKNKGVKYSSSKKSVVSVNSSGGLVAHKNGTATITAKTKAGGKTAKVKVQVVANGDSEGTQYRFYGIANNKYERLWDSYYKEYIKTSLPSCKNDLTYMNKMYTLANFGGNKVARTLKRDLTGNGIRTFLGSIASNSAIDDNDVTIFYYTGHGDDDGSLVGINMKSNGAYVSVAEVKSYLDQVPGTVIVILDSCYSGNYIQSKASALLSTQQKSQRAKLGTMKFNSAWVGALQKGKPAPGGKSALVSSKSLIDGGVPLGTYKILTACAPDEQSYAPLYPNHPDSPTSLGFFTTGLVDGMTASGSRSKADANGDGVVSLAEMHTHSNDVVQVLRQVFKLFSYETMTVMSWPQNDQTPVFSLAG